MIKRTFLKVNIYSNPNCSQDYFDFEKIFKFSNLI